MRKIPITIVLMFSLSSFYSCSDEDKSNVVSDDAVLEIYGEKMAIAQVVAWHDYHYTTPTRKDTIVTIHYEDENGNSVPMDVHAFTKDLDNKAGNFMLSFYGDGIRVNEEDKITLGEGRNLCLHLASPSLYTLTPGIYKFDEQSYKPNTFHGYYSTLYSEGVKLRDIAAIVQGEVVISEDDSRYQIVFDLITDTGIKIKGRYNGEVKIIRFDRVPPTEELLEAGPPISASLIGIATGKSIGINQLCL